MNERIKAAPLDRGMTSFFIIYTTRWW